MSEENSVTWLCQRCGRRQDIELETDPVLLRVCDSCKIENWTRPVKGVAVTEPELEVVAVLEEVVEPKVEVYVTKEPDIEKASKEAEIARLKAELAELEK